MTGHTLTISAHRTAPEGCDITALCSCGEYVLADEVAVTLDRLAELMHAHIMEAEATRSVDPVVNPRSVLPPEFYGDEPSPIEHTGPVLVDWPGDDLGHGLG